jgi:hypothetical protein
MPALWRRTSSPSLRLAQRHGSTNVANTVVRVRCDAPEVQDLPYQPRAIVSSFSSPSAVWAKAGIAGIARPCTVHRRHARTLHLARLGDDPVTGDLSSIPVKSHYDRHQGPPQVPRLNSLRRRAPRVNWKVPTRQLRPRAHDILQRTEARSCLTASGCLCPERGTPSPAHAWSGGRSFRSSWRRAALPTRSPSRAIGATATGRRACNAVDAAAARARPLRACRGRAGVPPRTNALFAPTSLC